MCEPLGRARTVKFKNLGEHLHRHKIRPKDFEAFALRWREVVIDMRAVRAGTLREHVFEFAPDDTIVQDLKAPSQIWLDG